MTDKQTDEARLEREHNAPPLGWKRAEPAPADYVQHPCVMPTCRVLTFAGGIICPGCGGTGT